MLRVVATLLAATWLLLAAVPAASGPDDVAEYLMEDPVSMLDWGVLRLEMVLSSRASDWVRPADVSVFYDWSRNRLTVEVRGDDALFSSEEDASTWARFAVYRVRDVFGYGGSTGERVFDDMIPIQKYFSHAGFKRGSEPESLYEELEGMLEVQVFVGYEGYTDLYVSCRGELKGTEVYFAQ